jgi:hypothetical protein
VEELLEIQPGARKRRRAQPDRALPGPAVQGTGILAVVVVRVERAVAIRLTVDPACWFQFWVAIFSGVVGVEDPDIPVVAVTVEWEEEVVERSIQTAVEPG